jgi:polar amino acid transport system permease protein
LIPILEFLLDGLWVTVRIALGGAALALVMAFVAGLARVSRDPILRGVSRTYVELFRGTSVVVQLFWFYFAFRPLLGLDLGALSASILVLGLNVGAYGAEVVRGAIQAVPHGQTEACISLNLTRWQRMRHVILPQALLGMLPPFGNLLIELLKATALVALIGVLDMTRLAQLRRDQFPLEGTRIFLILLVLYFCLSQLASMLVKGLERRLAKGRDHGGIR